MRAAVAICTALLAWTAPARTLAPEIYRNPASGKNVVVACFSARQLPSSDSGIGYVILSVPQTTWDAWPSATRNTLTAQINRLLTGGADATRDGLAAWRDTLGGLGIDIGLVRPSDPRPDNISTRAYVVIVPVGRSPSLVRRESGIGTATESRIPCDAFLVAGQSNIRGQPIATNALGALSQPQPAVSFHFETYNEDAVGVNNPALPWLFPLQPFRENPQVWGPEITLGYALAKDGNRHVAILKVARGGTSMADWLPDGGGHNPMFDFCVSQWVEFCSQLRSAGYEPTLRAMFWMQGESDSVNAELANNYARNFTTFYNALAAELGTRPPIFMARVHSTNLPRWPLIETVKAQQDTLARLVTDLIDTDGLTRTDGTHLDAAGRMRLGYLWATNYARSTRRGTIMVIR